MGFSPYEVVFNKSFTGQVKTEMQVFSSACAVVATSAPLHPPYSFIPRAGIELQEYNRWGPDMVANTCNPSYQEVEIG
jgi:hypothetical protein